MNRRRLTVGVALVVLAACSSGAPDPPADPGETATATPPAAAAPADARPCGDDLGPSPFERERSTHILIADFWDPKADAAYDASTVSEHIDAALRIFRDEELQDLPGDHDLSAAIEIQRLRCVVKDHDAASKIARAWSADLVIWGRAWRNPQAQITQNVKVEGSIEATDEAKVNVATVNITGSKPEVVSPSMTLNRREIRIYRSRPGAEREDLELPVFEAGSPFQLVAFSLGLHFYDRAEPWIAARLWERSAESVMARKGRGMDTLHLYLGRAYLEVEGRLEDALRHSRKALDMQADRSALRAATLINNIGSAIQAQGRARDAEKQFRRAMEIEVAALGERHPVVGRALNNLGGAMKDQGRFAEAEAHYRQAGAILAAAFGEEHPRVAVTINNTGNVLGDQGRYAEAEVQFRRALAMLSPAFGDQHPHVAVTHNNLGNALGAQGKIAEAEAHYRQSLKISMATLGTRHPSVAMALDNLGSALLERGEYAEAETQIRRALVISTAALGNQHPRVAGHLDNLGRALRKQSRFAEAEQHHRDALAIDRAAFGDRHPNVAWRLARLRHLLRTWAGKT